MFSVIAGETLHGNQRKSVHSGMQRGCWGETVRRGQQIQQETN